MLITDSEIVEYHESRIKFKRLRKIALILYLLSMVVPIDGYVPGVVLLIIPLALIFGHPLGFLVAAFISLPNIMIGINAYEHVKKKRVMLKSSRIMLLLTLISSNIWLFSPIHNAFEFSNILFFIAYSLWNVSIIIYCIIWIMEPRMNTTMCKWSKLNKK